MYPFPNDSFNCHVCYQKLFNHKKSYLTISHEIFTGKYVSFNYTRLKFDGERVTDDKSLYKCLIKTTGT